MRVESPAVSAYPKHYVSLSLFLPAPRYFVWTVERVLERVAVSMLSTQFIIEGSAVVCDARGWSLENVSQETGPKKIQSPDQTREVY